MSKAAFGSAGVPMHWARFKIGGRTGLFHLITVVEPPMAGSACGRMMFLSSQTGYAAHSDELARDVTCSTCLGSGREA